MADIRSQLSLTDGYTDSADHAIAAIGAIIDAMDRASIASSRGELTAGIDDIPDDAAEASAAIIALGQTIDGFNGRIPPGDAASDSFDGMRGAIVLASQQVHLLDQTLDQLDSDEVDNLNDTIDVTYREVENVHRSWKYLDKSIKDTSARPIERQASSFGNLSKAIIVANQALGLLQKGYQALSGIMNFADQRTSSDARLNLIKDELRTQEQLEEQVMRTANLTRTSYETTAELVAKVGRTEFFRGQNDAAIRFAETVNKAFAVGGATTAEAEGSIRQLTQALSSGVLRGDEFNSVMEGAPILAELLADELGVTKGELRELAADGALTADTVAAALLNQSDRIDEMFEQMPMTFSQGVTVIQNKISALVNDLSRPGAAFDRINQKILELITWLDTADGRQFLDGLADGAEAVIEGLIWVFDIASSVYRFFSDNWDTLGPIFTGIAVAVGIMSAAFTVYSTVMTIVNAVMAASPITWIILAVVALIAVITAVIVWLVKLWQTNIDFKVGVIRIWNSILGFFDQVPIFFIGIGYGIADGFSIAKEKSLLILQSMVNGAIGIINRFSGLINSIFGTSIDAISEVTFGAEASVQEQAARQARADDLAQRKADAAAKAAERETQLQADEARWRAEAAAKEAEAEAQKEETSGSETGWSWENKDVTVDGGTIDRVKKVDADLSDQTLAYLYDIAENTALRQFEALDAMVRVVYEETDAKLSDEDKDILLKSAGQGTRIYYLNYQGGVKVSNTVNQGDDWETIKAKAKAEADQEIETGLSEVEVILQQ